MIKISCLVEVELCYRVVVGFIFFRMAYNMTEKTTF